jgi:hypothetical protein
MIVLIDATACTIGGGVQVALAVLANAGQTKEVEWHVAASDTVARQADDATRSRFRSFLALPPGGRVRNWRNRRSLSRLEKLVQPDVTFTVFGPTPFRARSPHLQGFAVPRLIYPEYRPPSPPSAVRQAIDFAEYGLRRRWVRCADALVVESETVRQRSARHLPFDIGRIFVVGNSFSPIFESEVCQTKPKRGPVARVLVPSSYYPHKNLECIPAVASELRRALCRPFEVVLTLPPDEPAFAAILRAAKRLGVDDAISTVGHVVHAHYARLYSECDVVFLPTLLECSTAVYPEAFLAGRALVTSDMDFAHELCGDAAAFADPRDPIACAAAIARVLVEPDYAHDLVTRGTRRVRDAYPTPADKWQTQVSLLRRVATLGKRG